MAEVILMPRLSDTMTEGVIAEWHKNVGDTVKKGDVLAEVETDKATMDLESYKDGVLLHRGTDKGGKLQVNDLLAIVGAKGEDVAALIKQNSGGGAPKTEAAPAQEAAENDAPKEAAKKDQPGPKEQALDLSKMEEVILMPRLSDTMTEGVIASWHKKVGDMVKKGDVLADIETDKATMELESYKEGKLLYTGARDGEKIAVNELLAIIGGDAVDVQKIVAASKNGGASVNAQKEVTAPAESNAEQLAVEPTRSKEAVAPVTGPDDHAQADSNGRVKASPLAKKLAAEKGINIAEVHGSGDSGRIIKKDVDSFVPSKKEEVSQPASVSQKASAPAGQVSFDDVPISQMRKSIAKRLAESKFSAPHFYLTIKVDMDSAVASRTKLN
nr:E3 binding domain-containing protein [Chitinophagaceae bacterium]